MSSKEHKKHADLARPTLGQFGRNEWAIVGTNCGIIKKLAFHLTAALSSQWKVAYVDADHKGADEGVANDHTALSHGAMLEYTDKINFHRFDQQGGLSPFQYRPVFNEADLVLVNGNHFTAKQQIVVVDPKKEDSLRRKADRLSDVRLVLLTEGVAEMPDFLAEILARSAPVPVLQFTDFQGVTSFLQKEMTERRTPSLEGLILAGGKSLRMGTDKGSLVYHGKPQRDYLQDLIAPFCQTVSMSCRPDQAEALGNQYVTLPDTFLGLGPMGAILSAFRSKPDSAWLVLACDLPLLDEATLGFLVENRDPSAVATAFRSPENDFPEPLIAIWEPKSYLTLLQFLSQGYSCPRKALINSPVRLLDAPNPAALRNVNTPEEHEAVLTYLREIRPELQPV
jgi:molybdopterin-guanine dinucleotide biosynthesis protein A